MRSKVAAQLAATDKLSGCGNKIPVNQKLKDKLEDLFTADWNFTNAKTNNGTHSIHPYPAKFIPQIPRQLIQRIRPPKGSFVFDPFCGSGTTLLEAQAAGYPSIGIDLNPIASMIARVKTRPPSRPISPLASQLAKSATQRKAPIPSIPRVDHWFKKDVQQALANLVNVIGGIEDEATREALQIALSSIIVRVSNQDGDTRYAAIQKPSSSDSVYDLFKLAAAGIDRGHLEEHGGLFRSDWPEARIITKDILLAKPSEIGDQVGLVITSPPYPNAYEYWLYHKYRMYWLGMDPLTVRKAEIGARPHYFKKNHQTEVDFEKQMASVFRLLASTMLPEALACFIVGRSIIHGRVVDNVALLERAALPNGFRRLIVVERVIPSTRKAFNPAHGTINTEAVVVFGR